MTETLVSPETCVAFPIACALIFLGVSTLWVGWQLIVFAWIGQRFTTLSGGALSAHKILTAAELQDELAQKEGRA